MTEPNVPDGSRPPVDPDNLGVNPETHVQGGGDRGGNAPARGNEPETLSDEQIEDMITQRYDGLDPELKKRIEDEGTEEYAKEILARQFGLSGFGPIGDVDEHGVPSEEEKEFREHTQKEGSALNELYLALAPKAFPTDKEQEALDKLTRQDELRREAEDPDDTEQAASARSAAEEALKTARAALDDPHDERKREEAKLAMEHAYDPELVEKLQKTSPWYYKVLVSVGIAFYLYIGLQFAMASMAESWGKSGSKSGGH